ncbi:hypothetical protein [Pareuzebyella sediminis]|uniref:hypothetical protein n=1 Tax=Pareuzebyella sediminis TaxID=2607998 RepID=UPI0011F03C28|nr:hypothetical protein [Pareuzebyella sediminis]
MKKHSTLFAILFFTITTLSAQEFQKGTNVINAGIGLGGAYGSYTTSSQSIGLSASYERGIWEVPGPGVVSLGGFLGFKTYDYDYVGGRDRWRYTVIGVRGAYHYNGLNVENLDLYGGAMVSYRILSYNGSTGSYGSRPGASGFVGARWFFTDGIAAFAEAGYGFAFLSVGVSFRF